MTLIDLLGEDAFYIKVSGYKVKRMTQKTADGEYFEEDDTLYYKNIGTDKATCISGEIGEWTVLPDGKVIYNNFFTDCKDNSFCISDTSGDRIASGVISPDGRLIFVRNGLVYEQTVGQAPKVLIDETFCTPCVYLDDDNIYAFVSFSGTDIMYSKVYDFNGNLFSEETQTSLLMSFNSHIWFGLASFNEYQNRVNSKDDIDPWLLQLYHDQKEMYINEVSYENIEKISEVLKKYGLLSSISYNGYLKLKALFLSCGISDNIEIPLATVSCISQRNFGQINRKIVSAKFVRYLKELRKTTDKELFVKMIRDSRLLMSQMKKDGKLATRENEDFY